MLMTDDLDHILVTDQQATRWQPVIIASDGARIPCGYPVPFDRKADAWATARAAAEADPTAVGHCVMRHAQVTRGQS